jgi:hypothetical protein
MIIADLPYLMTISDLDRVKGGEQNNYYNNNNDYNSRAVAVALAYADGSETFVVAATSVYVGPGISQSQAFAQAQAF